MIRFRPFEPAHLAEIELQKAQLYLKPRLSERKTGELYHAPGLAFSGFLGDEICGAAGVRPSPERAGVGVGWAVFGEFPPTELLAWVEITRKTRAVIDFALKSGGFHRIEAMADADFPQALRWLGLLGFTREGYHAAYIGGRDMVSYARLRGDRATGERAGRAEEVAA